MIDENKRMAKANLMNKDKKALSTRSKTTRVRTKNQRKQAKFINQKNCNEIIEFQNERSSKGNEDPQQIFFKLNRMKELKRKETITVKEKLLFFLL